MKERPIIFNAEMVNAILSGRKTQTRRVIQSPAKSMQAHGMQVIEYREAGDKWYGDHVFSMRSSSGTWHDYTKEQFLAKCPFGEVGDRLYVRESFSKLEEFEFFNPKVPPVVPDFWYWADGEPTWGNWTRPASGAVMPKAASRITLEITDVRVERLNSISEEDAKSEGVGSAVWFAAKGVPEGEWTSLGERGAEQSSHINSFATLWESIYGAESWQANSWVWVIEFRRVDEGATS